MSGFHDDIAKVRSIEDGGEETTSEGSIDDHRARSRWGLPGAVDHDEIIVQSAGDVHQREAERNGLRTSAATIEAHIAARRERRALPRPVVHAEIETLNSEEWHEALNEARGESE